MDDDHRSYRGRNAAAALFLNVSRRLVVAQIHGVMAAATMLLGLQFSPLESSRYASVGEAMDLPACVAPAGFSTLIPSPSFEHDQTLFWLDMGADNLWRSSDDGASWRMARDGYLNQVSIQPVAASLAASIRLVEPERQVYFPLVMGSAAAPAPRPLALFVSAGTPYRSTDGGVSWYAIP